jgi:hypothetical protein
MKEKKDDLKRHYWLVFWRSTEKSGNIFLATDKNVMPPGLIQIQVSRNSNNEGIAECVSYLGYMTDEESGLNLSPVP